MVKCAAERACVEGEAAPIKRKSLQLRCVANAVTARVALFSRKWISEGCASDPVERTERVTLCSLFGKRRGKIRRS